MIPQNQKPTSGRNSNRGMALTVTVSCCSASFQSIFNRSSCSSSPLIWEWQVAFLLCHRWRNQDSLVQDNLTVGGKESSSITLLLQVLDIVTHHRRGHEMGLDRSCLVLGWGPEWSILFCPPCLTDSQPGWSTSITILLPLPTLAVATQICFQALRKPVGSSLQSIFAQVPRVSKQARCLQL